MKNIKQTQKSSTRLFVILARKSSLACIFRRGPSKQVLLIKWDRKTDTFECGQWLKGRIYERRCDLSPSGDKLIYLAAKWKGPIDSWTAVSRPPYLSALALWPNLGAWGGGGLFEYDNVICLNHRFDMGYDKLGGGFNIPKRITIQPLGEHSGHGEDDPIYHLHLLRDGWTMIAEGKGTEHPYKPSSKIWITYDPPITYQKTNRRKNLSLLMQVKGYHEWGGTNYVIEYVITQNETHIQYPLGRLDWADWDRNGDLLFARSGRLYRFNTKRNPDMDLNNAKELADFRDLKFEEKTAPAKYCKW